MFSLKRIISLTAVNAVAFIALWSCAAAWRGDGPPESIENTSWVGTNKARGEIIFMEFGSGEDMRLLFTFPSTGNAEERDTVSYSGKYTYDYHPSNDGTGSIRGTVSMSLTDDSSGGKVSAYMSYHNQRFYLTFKGSAYPSDPA